MDEHVIAAVRERISLGYTKEEITAELSAGGYDADLAAQYYESASAAAAPTPPPVPAPEPTVITTPAPSPAPDPDTSTPISAALAASPTRHIVADYSVADKNHSFLPAILIGLLISATAIGGYWLYTQSGQMGSSSFGAAPYDSDEELFLGMALSLSELDDEAIDFNISYGIELLPKAPGEQVPTLPGLEQATALLEQTPVTVLPDEGHIKFSAGGVIDPRDEENPEFDITIEIDALIEPIIFGAIGSVRVVDNNLYIRIEDIPALFKPVYQAEVPAQLGTWMLVGPLDELQNTAAGVLQSTPGIENLPRRLNLAPETTLLLPDLAAVFQGWVGTQQQQMLASLGAIQFKAGVDEQKIMTLLEQNPPFRIIGEPQPVTTDDGSIYRYELQLDIYNLRTVLEGLPDALPAEEQAAAREAFAEPLRDLPDQAAIDEFSKIMSLYADFTSGGDFQAFRVAGEVTDTETSTSKMALLLVFGMQPAQTPDIAVPTNVHSDSIMEMMEERQRQQMTEQQEAFLGMRMMNMRTQAEIWYSENGFTYEGFCDELLNDPSLSQEDTFECADSARSYQVAHQLTSRAGYNCIDSTGYMDTVTLVDTDPATSCSEADQ